MCSYNPSRWLAALLLGVLVHGPAAAQSSTEALARFETASRAAEDSLREGERELADSRYRDVLMNGWLLLGGLDAADGRWEAAKESFERASSAAVEQREAVLALAFVQLQLGRPADAVSLLSRLSSRHPTDLPARRLLAQALDANKQPQQAVQELEEAARLAPGDPEYTFLLASAYLRVKNLEAASRLFDEVAKARPTPQAWVLIGRTYRDAGEYARARAALEQALTLDPRVRRAHYYLGTIATMSEGAVRLEEAIREYRQELQIDASDAPTNLRLGAALVDARREEEALPPLELAARAELAPADAFYHLGRCLLALNRPAEAVPALQRALQLGEAARVGDTQIAGIHYQLGRALRATGATAESATHFTEAERLVSTQAEASREQMARYLSDTPDREATGTVTPIDMPFPLAALPSGERAAVRAKVTEALARAYLNLGVMQAQASRFTRAAEFFEQVAALDPLFPDVQYSLGLSYFNAQQHAKAAAALDRALRSDPGDPRARRMLAIALLNTEQYKRAAEMLRNIPGRDTDFSLQYAFALALMRSDRAADAEIASRQLMAGHADSPEVNLLLGQALAQRGDYDSAVAPLQRALVLKPDLREANGSLGVIYLRQGRLDDAEAALRAELRLDPGDATSRQNLAVVLDKRGASADAVRVLRGLLQEKPDYKGARYLLGKILLSQGAAAEAVEHLEAAARLDPEDASVHYQLAQAYQKTGRAELAEREFDRYRELKDKRRGGQP